MKIYKLDRIERWYDRHTRCWWVRRVDAAGNQIGEAENCYTAREARASQRQLVKQLEWGRHTPGGEPSSLGQGYFGH
jgi:hypothetical protein